MQGHNFSHFMPLPIQIPRASSAGFKRDKREVCHTAAAIQSPLASLDSTKQQIKAIKEKIYCKASIDNKKKRPKPNYHIDVLIHVTL